MLQERDGDIAARQLKDGDRAASTPKDGDIAARSRKDGENAMATPKYGDDIQLQINAAVSGIKDKVKLSENCYDTTTPYDSYPQYVGSGCKVLMER